MRGSDLKILLMRLGFTQASIAEKLGISQQNFNSNLRSEDVKSSIIEKIAATAGVPISALYGEVEAPGSANAIGNNNTAVAGNNNSLNAEKLLDLLREKDIQMARYQDQIDRVLTIIEKGGTK